MNKNNKHIKNNNNSTSKPRRGRGRNRQKQVGIYKHLTQEEYSYKVTTEFNITFCSGHTGAYGLQEYTPGSIPSTWSSVATGSGFNGMAVSFGFQNVYVYIGTNAAVGFTNTNFTALQNLYDEFKIDKVAFRMNYNSNSSNVTGNSTLPTVLIAADYDDVTAPITASGITGFAGSKYLNLGQNSSAGQRAGFQVFDLKPKAMQVMTLYNPGSTIGGTTAISAAIAAPWLDTEFGSDVQHYGVKLYFDNNTLGAAVTAGYMIVYVDTYLRFRKVK